MTPLHRTGRGKLRQRTISWIEGVDWGNDASLGRSVDLTLDLLNRSPAPFHRETYDPGHITGSAVVLSPELDRVLLVLHMRLGKWLQPGGHVEPVDADVFETARREIDEETGVALATEPERELIGVDVHVIPAAGGEPDHLHHDLTFGLVAATDDLPPSPEGLAMAWCPVDTLATYDVDGSLRRCVATAIQRWRG